MNMTWKEAKEYMRKFNRDNNYSRDNRPERFVTIVAVMKNKGFKRTDLTACGGLSAGCFFLERSYEFTNDNKAFLDGMLGYSIFADAIDGTDDCVRLDCYVEEDNIWEVDHCYIKSED